MTNIITWAAHKATVDSSNVFGSSAAQSMVEKAMSTLPDDPAQTAVTMALLLPLYQTPIDPEEIAVRPCTHSTPLDHALSDAPWLLSLSNSHHG